MAENNVVPAYADKLLFAEDLMNHALMKHAVETKYKRRTAEIYRTFVRNAFNETIEEAVTFMYKELDKESENIFLNMFSERSVNLENYTKYAKNISKKYYTGYFDAQGFMYYCAKLAGLAAAFHKGGFVDVPDLAINYIVDAIYNVDMTTDGWDTLNEVCKVFVNTKKNSIELAPYSTSDEAASTPSGEQNLDESGAPYPIKIIVGSSCYLKEDFKKYEVKIKKISLKEYQARFNNNSSTENKEDLKKLKVRYPPSSANSSNFGGNCGMKGSSSGDTFAPGTSNSTGISVLSVKGDNLDLPLNDVNLDSARNISPPTSEMESSMLEITSRSERHYSGSEEDNFPDKKS